MNEQLLTIKEIAINDRISITMIDNNKIFIYSSNNPNLELQYTLNNNDDFLRDAFNKVAQSITDNNNNPLLSIKAETEDLLNDIVARYGLGVAYIMLHANGILNKYLEASSSESVDGNMYKYIHVPIRNIRGDIKELMNRGIFADTIQTEPLIVHDDQKTCFFCSAPRQTYKELLIQVNIEGTTYECGFNFAPFGNPLDVFHAVMWEKVEYQDKVSNKEDETIVINDVPNMNYTNKTISDLIKLVNQINSSITENFLEINGNKNVKIIGLFNGWAGNSIYHQHFQFARIDLPITKAKIAKSWKKTNGIIEKLEWPLDVYKITSNTEQDLIVLSKDIVDKWHSLSNNEIISLNMLAYPEEEGLYVFYFIPRMRNKITYEAQPQNKIFGKIIPTKANIAGLETAGYMLADDYEIIKFIKEHKSEPNFKEEVDKLLGIPLQSIQVNEEYISQLENYLDLYL
jgi:hypothetical protein